jgi:CRP-like cAMP-binding protein
MDIPSTSIPKLVEGTTRDRSLPALERLAILGRYDTDTDQCVYHCNDSIEHWYRVVRGAARSSALSDDGRRYIVDFVFPGDLFGFCDQRVRHFCVEALVSGIEVLPQRLALYSCQCRAMTSRTTSQWLSRP